MSPLDERSFRPSGPGVWVAGGSPVILRREDLEALKTELATVKSLRARICVHGSMEDPVHEMMLALGRGTWLRPHGHSGKSESFHVIEGQASVVIFDSAGAVQDWIRLGDLPSGLPFYFRIHEDLCHTLFVESDCLLVHETTRGPFRSGQSTVAPWSPAALDPDEVFAYREKLWSAWIARAVGREEGGRGRET